MVVPSKTNSVINLFYCPVKTLNTRHHIYEKTTKKKYKFEAYILETLLLKGVTFLLHFVMHCKEQQVWKTELVPKNNKYSTSRDVSFLLSKTNS